MNQHLRLTTVSRTGVPVHLQPCGLMTGSIQIDGKAQPNELFPHIVVPEGLITAAKRHGGVRTRTARMDDGDSAIGVVHLRGGGGLAMLLMDLGEPQVHAWLERAIARHYLPVGLSCGGRWMQTRIRIDDAQLLVDRLSRLEPAGIELMTEALRQAVNLLCGAEHESADILEGVQEANVGVLIPDLAIEPGLH